MRQKSDRKKLAEGRCAGDGSDYVGFIRANEAKSIGTATEVYDPIADRTVDVLSRGEKEFFWTMRYRDDVLQIQEQMLLNTETVNEICRRRGFRKTVHVLSTDFLVTFSDGSKTAYSIKADRDEFDRNSRRYRICPEKYEKLLERQVVEKEYWEMHGVQFCIIFREDLNHAFARNVENCMRFYRGETVCDKESLLKHLIAHKKLVVPLDKRIVQFADLAKKMDMELEEVIHGYQTERIGGN